MRRWPTSLFFARRVLDVGCGTGILACRLAARGIDTVGVDPAAAMLAVARRREGADRVRWVHGGVKAAQVLGLSVDLAVMTGNVAQVFVEDRDWAAALGGLHHLLAPGGRLVFETRDPAAAAWRVRSAQVVSVPGRGAVDQFHELTAVAPGRVSFRTTVRLRGEGTELASDSTLRFRDRQELAASIVAAGLELQEVRGAPGRPGGYGAKACKPPGSSVSRWMRRRAPAGRVMGKCTA